MELKNSNESDRELEDNPSLYSEVWVAFNEDRTEIIGISYESPQDDQEWTSARISVPVLRILADAQDMA